MNKVYIYKMSIGGMNSEIVREDGWRVIDGDELSFKVEGVMVGGGDEDCVYVMSDKELKNSESVVDDNSDLDEYWDEVNEIGEVYFMNV